ncbi:MAG: DUF2844 domain-containing protein [Thiobacillaceae bacterium]
MRVMIGLLFSACALVTLPTYAKLGGDESDISTEAVNAKMALRPVVASARPYRTYEMTDDGRNVSVRQYVNSDAKVFGVAWSGQTKPDLSQVLGPYYSRYVEAASGHGMVQPLRRIDQPDFVLRVSGHMRHFMGAAWVPGLVPANVDPTELK